MPSINTDGRIVKNFTLFEMANKKTKNIVKLVLNEEVIEFAQMVQELRDWYGKPITVNSWFRTKEFNARCGGSRNSLHLDGLAMDWGIKKQTDRQRENIKNKWKEICGKHHKVGGINFYTNGYHIDCKEDKFGYKNFVIRDYRGKKGDW